MKFFIAAMLILVTCSELHAQDAPPSNNKVTVTAPKDPEAAAESASSTTDLQPMEMTVKAKRIQPQASFDRIERYDGEYIERTEAFTAKELLESLPPGPPGTKPVILIDGRETPFDLENLPVGMIEQLEINRDGTLPRGGPRVAGNVINIVLKQDYVGADLNLRQKSSFEGGGSNNQVTASGGYKKRSLNLTATATHNVQHSLLASERDFSREQDHTAMGGRDFRLGWGYPLAVQALSGNLNGVVDANGQPVATALMPLAVPSGGLTPGDFIAGPAGVTSASGLRRFSTADYLYLTSPSKNGSVGLQLRYPITEAVRLNAHYNFGWSEADRLAPPPVTEASASTVVPAAYSPFGQDVAVGFVHTAFGPVRRDSSSTNHSAMLSVDGLFGSTWNWGAHLNFRRSDSDSSTRELDQELFIAALSATDPAQRFNPFAESSADLYPALTRMRQSDNMSESTNIGADIRGAVSDGWVGPIYINLGIDQGFSHGQQEEYPVLIGSAFGTSESRVNNFRTNANVNVPVFKVLEQNKPATLSLSSNWSNDRQELDVLYGSAVPDTHISTLSLDSTLNVPWVAPADERPLLRQLETRIGVGRATRSGEDGSQTQNLGVLWAPYTPLTFRANLAKHQIQPPIAFYRLTIDYNQTLLDPLRNIPTALDVEVLSGTPFGLEASLNRSQTFSIEYTPPVLKGLRLSANYLVQDQRNQVRSFSAQDIVDNEAVLGDRVTRLPATPEDIAAGQPGQIVRVDVTPLNAGKIQSRSVDFSMHYNAQEAKAGRLWFSMQGRRLLRSDNELLPGVPIISGGDEESPPDWTFSGQANWGRKGWHVGGNVTYVGAGRYGGFNYDAYSSVDLRFGYRIKNPWGQKFGKRLHLGGGIGNLFDTKPPFVDTVTGFRGASALGRTYEISLRVPFKD